MRNFCDLIRGCSAITFSFALITTTIFAFASHAYADDAKPQLVIGGTGSALGGMQLLAKAFSEDHPDIKAIVLPSLGSGGGIKALSAGKIDLALSARPLKDKESEQGLTARLYARTPIVFATHKKISSDRIDLSELVSIYSGTTSVWADGTSLRLILRPEEESDTKLLRGLSPEMDAAVTAAHSRKDLLVALNDQDNATALETVPGSFGLTTLAQILSESRSLKPLVFNGKTASLEALQAGEYPYFKSLHIVAGNAPSAPAKAFIAFVFSTTGQNILTATGHSVADPGQ
ncbi:substrate-binding domain-containing protein [uncultured Roseibium sp.]|uniref:substrate-binding domain-containing protein n=1 Tax=uncultured Roseibium sp. TaxID=1936171 RepID=UPI0032179409